MQEQQANTQLPRPLRFYIGIVAVAGLVWLAFLLGRLDWELSHVGEIALFISLIVIAGSFPLPIAPKVKTDVAATVIFAGALLFEPGIAALVAVVGISIYTVLIRFWGERIHLPWYKYPFNAGVAALFAGVASIVFESLSADRELMSPAVAAVAVSSYLVNTAMVSGAVSLQLRLNPISVWWKGNKEYGLAELSLFSFGFLGAVVYKESPGTVLALFIPVAVIYLAFSRLARINTQLEEALAKLEAIQGRIVSTAKLASIGALSLDLAHQIKNPLAILLGRLEGLQDRIESGTKERRHLDTAIDAGWRIQELTQTFSAIGHQKVGRPGHLRYVG